MRKIIKGASEKEIILKVFKKLRERTRKQQLFSTETKAEDNGLC